MARTEAPGVGRVRLRKRKGGNWYARFQDANRRYEVALRVTNRTVAEAKAAEINDALERGWPWELVLSRPPDLSGVATDVLRAELAKREEGTER